MNVANSADMCYTYGKQIAITGTSDIIFCYNGRDGVVTEDNGLIYMRARYYSPDMRRFVDADIVAGNLSNAITLNRFAYANGNPVSFVDPFGLEAARVSTTKDDNGWYTEELSSAIHFVLDIAGFIPGWGAIADALNALVYALEGDWLNAGMSALAAIPGLGDIASGCKWASKLFSKMTRDEIGEWATSGSAYQKGLKGEFLAEINQSEKYKNASDVGGRMRVPDGVNGGY